MKTNYKRNNLILLISLIIITSALMFGFLLLLKVFYFDNGIKFNAELLKEYQGKWYIYLIFLALEIPITVFQCFVPMTNTMFISLAILMFGANWRSFVVCLIGITVSSLILDLIGRYGGSKVAIKMLGEQNYNKAKDLIDKKGYTYLPFIYLQPFIPVDAICMISGMAKINFKYHLIVILICRGINLAIIVFGVGIIPYDKYIPLTKENIFNWVILGGVLISYVSLALKIAQFIDKKRSEKK